MTTTTSVASARSPLSRKADRGWARLAWLTFSVPGLYALACLGRLIFTFHEKAAIQLLLDTRPLSAPDDVASLNSTEHLLAGLIIAGQVLTVLLSALFVGSSKAAMLRAQQEPWRFLRHWSAYLLLVGALANAALLWLINGPTYGPYDPSTGGESLATIAHQIELSMAVRILAALVAMAGLFWQRREVEQWIRD